MVAFEMDGILRLVKITARVYTDGRMELKRTSIVDGPYTNWQTGVAMGRESEAAATDADMRAEVERARKLFFAALQPERTLENLWAVSRVTTDARGVRALFGAPAQKPGGPRLAVYKLADQTEMHFWLDRRRIKKVVHQEPKTDHWKVARTLHRVATR